MATGASRRFVATMSLVAPSTTPLKEMSLSERLVIGVIGWRVVAAACSRRTKESAASPPRNPRHHFTTSPLRPAHRPHLRALAPTAVEPIATVRLEPRHEDALRHLELLQHLARRRVDAPHVALFAFPRA